MAKRGERIGALLIVGGPEIVPFHCLPNPVDDQDNDVPSDNPYATRDENFFIPEWPVGRLPGGAGKDARLMLDALQRFQAAHAAYKRRLSLKKRLQRWLVAQIEKFRLDSRRSFGYTAAIWKNAAASVFQPIGKPGWLHVSPPSGVGSLKSGQQNGKRSTSGGVPKPVGRLAYFNLHGLVDAPEWFGHRDLLQSSEDEVDYPVAFRPQDVQGGSPLGEVPKVIFSEACYGMHIQNRALDEAIALKFLEAGSLAIAGSTCMAYGSYGAMDNSLVAADLLGHSFWKFLKDGMPAGEALRQAKIFLASEMDHRQGYLDGLDQKTLISFVLYGDPLADPLRKGKIPKSIRYRVNPVVEMHTICERPDARGGYRTRARGNDGRCPAGGSEISARYVGCPGGLCLRARRVRRQRAGLCFQPGQESGRQGFARSPECWRHTGQKLMPGWQRDAAHTGLSQPGDLEQAGAALWRSPSGDRPSDPGRAREIGQAGRLSLSSWRNRIQLV